MINWGIIGLGNIAHTFAQDLILTPNATLKGVASRSIEKAKAFGQQYHSSTYYGSYEELAMDDSIDVIYIATPHVFHFENTMLCLSNNKHVLCEKPMGMDANEVEIMTQEAKRRNLFLMEAMWTRFTPCIEKLLELINDDAIGELKGLRADFGFKGNIDPEGRILNKKLGGGALLDIGIYPIYFSLLVAGIPKDINAFAKMTATGVDASCNMLFRYKNGVKANLECTVENTTPTEAYLFGSAGYIKVHSQFYHPTLLSLHMEDEVVQFEIPYKGNGYVHEIEEVIICLKNNQQESSLMTHTTSINLARIIDRVKKQINLSYDI